MNKTGFTLIPGTEVPAATDSQEDIKACQLLEYPQELLLLIFSKLPSPKDVAHLGLTCRQLQQLSKDDVLWNTLYRTHIPHHSAKHPQKSNRRYLNLYKDCFAFERNMRKGKSTQLALTVNEKIAHIEAYGNLLCSISEADNEATLTIWNMANGKHIQTFPIAGLDCNLSAIENRLYLCLNGTIRFYDIETAECLNPIELDDIGEDSIDKMVSKKNRLYALFENGMIKIWDITTGKCLQTFQDDKGWHSPGGSEIEIVKNYICMFVDSPSNENSRLKLIKFLNIATGQSQTFNDGGEVIKNFTFFGDHIVSSYESNIRIWDLKSGKCIQSILGFEPSDEPKDRIDCLEVVGNRLYTSTAFDRIKIWDITDLANIVCVPMPDGFANGIMYKEMIGTCLYMLYDDAMKILDIPTGECQTLISDEEGAGSIQYFKVAKNRLITFSDNLTIGIWCLETKTCLHQFKAEGEMFIEDGILKREYLKLFGNFLYLQSVNTEGFSTIEIYDVATGNRVKELSDPDPAVRFKAIGHRVVAASLQDANVPLRIWDFGCALEANLTILREMASPEKLQKFTDSTDIMGHLHPDIQQRLSDHPLSAFDPSSAIRHVRVEVCGEALLRAIQDENGEKGHEFLGELKAIDPGHAEKLYELLWIECGKPDVPKKNGLASLTQNEISEAITELNVYKSTHAMDTEDDAGAQETRDPFQTVDEEMAAFSESPDNQSVQDSIHQWGERAFYDVPGYNAPIECKIQAMLKFLATLYRT